MKFLFSPMNEADAHAIQHWTYEEPYDVYNWEAEGDISEMLDTRSPHYSVKDEHGTLIGFFSYGSSALVWDSGEPHLFCDNNTIPRAITISSKCAKPYNHLRRRKYHNCNNVMIPIPTNTIQNKYPPSCSTCGKWPKFMPKTPVMKVIGIKIVAMIVSCFIDKFKNSRLQTIYKRA